MLSPVYDLVPKPETGSTRYLAMPFGKKGREFNVDNLLSSAEAFDLSKKDAKAIYENLKSTTSHWRSFFTASGLANADILYLENAFNHWEAL
jgi:serine/threonine-protein kinase HipA